MAAGDHLHADQFRYLIQDIPGNASLEAKAFHPETGREVGWLSVRAREYATHQSTRKRVVKLVPTETPAIHGAFVHPDFQRQGIGKELFDITAHHLGRTPMHDTTVTPEAQAWAAKVGGELQPEMTTGMSHPPETLRRVFNENYTTTYQEHLERGKGGPWQRPKQRQLRLF